MSCGAADAAVGTTGFRSLFLAIGEFGYRSQHLTPMTKRHPDLFKVLIGEIGEDRKAHVVFGKALRVLHEIEPFEPVRPSAASLKLRPAAAFGTVSGFSFNDLLGLRLGWICRLLLERRFIGLARTLRTRHRSAPRRHRPWRLGAWLKVERQRRPSAMLGGSDDPPFPRPKFPWVASRRLDRPAEWPRRPWYAASWPKIGQRERLGGLSSHLKLLPTRPLLSGFALHLAA